MGKIDKIIKENIDNFLLKEYANNEDAPLYHFTSLEQLSEIIGAECLKDKYKWGGVSFSRNRNSDDGYPSLDPIMEVRICFSPTSLMRLRGVKIEPYSFFYNGHGKSAKSDKIEKSRMVANNPKLKDTVQPNSMDEFETVVRNIDSIPLDLCDSIDILLRNSSKNRIYRLAQETWNFEKYLPKMIFYIGKNDFNFKRNGKRFDEIENIIFGVS